MVRERAGGAQAGISGVARAAAPGRHANRDVRQLSLSADAPARERISASPSRTRAGRRRYSSIDLRDPLIGFESPPYPERRFVPLRAQGGTPLLRWKSDGGDTMDAAAMMPWGGYVLSPYEIISLPNDGGNRWVVQPFEFLRRALALPGVPAAAADHRERTSTDAVPLALGSFRLPRRGRRQAARGYRPGRRHALRAEAKCNRTTLDHLRSVVLSRRGSGSRRRGRSSASALPWRSRSFSFSPGAGS